jgi:FKBP-type peptidyl-prolyl cis-trans isomerase
MKIKIIYMFLCVLFISTVVCGKNGQTGSKANLSSEKGKYSYAVGYNVGSGMARDNLELDMDSFMAAREDALAGVDSKLTQEESQTVMENLMKSLHKKRNDLDDENVKKGKDFLSKNK